MKRYAQLNPNFQLCKKGDVYTISHLGGRDLFYYRPPAYPIIGIDYPHNLSINIANFGDQIMAHCATQITYNCHSDQRLEFFLIILFNRLLKHVDHEIYFIEDCLLDRSGSYNPLLHESFNERYIDLLITPNQFFKLNEAYSLQYNSSLFLFIVKEMKKNEYTKNAQKIPRKIFESAISNEQLADAYTEEYHSDSEFYFEKNKGLGSFDILFSGAFFMVLNQRIQLLIFVPEELASHKELPLYDLQFVN